MKNLVCFLLLIAFKSYSQETVLVETKFPDSKQISESFYVLKSNGKTKQGEYIAYFRISEEELKQIKKRILKLDNYIKVKCNYENGKKNGDWVEHSSSTSMKKQGRYSMDKKVGVWLTYKEHGAVEERFDYDMNLKLQPLIHINTPYPPIARENGIEGTVEISYKINSDCTVSNIQIEKGLTAECDTTAMKSIRRFGELLKKYGVVCNDSIARLRLKFTLR